MRLRLIIAGILNILVSILTVIDLATHSLDDPYYFYQSSTPRAVVSLLTNWLKNFSYSLIRSFALFSNASWIAVMIIMLIAFMVILFTSVSLPTILKNNKNDMPINFGMGSIFLVCLGAIIAIASIMWVMDGMTVYTFTSAFLAGVFAASVILYGIDLKKWRNLGTIVEEGE